MRLLLSFVGLFLVLAGHARPGGKGYLSQTLENTERYLSQKGRVSDAK